MLLRDCNSLLDCSNLMPRPQLKLISFDLSEESINPPAPAVPRFPLGAPSKKIVAFEAPCHHLRKSPLVRHNRQVGAFIDLLTVSFLSPDAQNPIHLEVSSGRGEAKTVLSTISNMMALTLASTSTEFGSLLLKRQSFLANHTFHQRHFGIACQMFFQTAFLVFFFGF